MLQIENYQVLVPQPQSVGPHVVIAQAVIAQAVAPQAISHLGGHNAVPLWKVKIGGEGWKPLSHALSQSPHLIATCAENDGMIYVRYVRNYYQFLMDNLNTIQ